MTKKLVSLLLAVCVLMSLAACSRNKQQGSGTEEDPWLCGATKDDDVRVYVMDEILYVYGDGAMADYDKLKDRPWNDIIGDIACVNIFDGLAYVGKNAFKGAGVNCECFDVYLCDEVKAIGESAFEGVSFSFEDETAAFEAMFSIPSGIESIGPRAFADTDISQLYFYSIPEIADDAFLNVKAKAYVINGSGWNEENELDYGGELDYKLQYKFDYEEDYGTEDVTGSGTMNVPEDEPLSYDAAACACDGYHFVRYEVLGGELTLDDPTNPLLESMLTGDVQIKIVYEAD